MFNVFIYPQFQYCGVKLKTVNSSLVTMKSLVVFVTLFAFASLMPKKYLIETEANVDVKKVNFAV